MTVPQIIDDRRQPGRLATTGTRWEAITDRVMGGLSDASLTEEVIATRPALRLRGTVRLENNGGFVQMALDLAPSGAAVDARGWDGVALVVRGNCADYGLHLRTTDCLRPWQSYRHGFTAGPDWAAVLLPFAGFTPHRLEAPLNPARLRRLGLVAIGTAGQADMAVADLRFWRRAGDDAANAAG